MEVLDLTKEFYMLQMVSLEAMAEPFLKSHNNWEKDFYHYKNLFEEKFAMALKDYTVLSLFGEMRHGSERAEYYNYNVPQGNNRNSAYYTARLYTPESIAKASLSAFNCEWGEAYGGKKWLQIAKSFFLSEKVNNTVYIDYCVDLQHNGGSFLNKWETRIFKVDSDYNLKLYLNEKREYSINQMLDVYASCSETLRILITRAVNLEILDGKWRIYFSLLNMDVFKKLYAYEGIKFGEAELDDDLEYSPSWRYDEDDEYEEEEDEYEEKEGYESCDDFFYYEKTRSRSRRSA